ncbi:MAG: biotin synthase BioB [Cyanobacteriota bacterium]
MKTINKKEQAIQEYYKLYELPLKTLQQQANDLTTKNFKNKIELCSIISAKTGQCSEDCSYCAQSVHHKTDCKTHQLIDVETVVNAANDSKINGASRFCVVTSGKGIDNNHEFDKVLKMVKKVADIDGLHSCCSLGIVSYEQAVKLKEAGVERFNHNVNTAKSFYKNICTTHDYEERIQTAINIKSAGIELCCGCIIGMGETRQQRIEMALEIKELEPVSVPINILHPIPGTPMEKVKNTIDTEEILKTIAIFRIIMPDVLIRYAGGRTHNLNTAEQLEGLKCGVNALLVGNYLTTTGNLPDNDHKLISEAKLEILKD